TRKATVPPLPAPHHGRRTAAGERRQVWTRVPHDREGERLRLHRLPEPLNGEDGVAVASQSRVASIDLIRGAVMVLMAIDHVRVYSGLPAGGPTPGIFFTRWV